MARPSPARAHPRMVSGPAAISASLLGTRMSQFSGSDDNETTRTNTWRRRSRPRTRRRRRPTADRRPRRHHHPHPRAAHPRALLSATAAIVATPITRRAGHQTGDRTNADRTNAIPTATSGFANKNLPIMSALSRFTTNRRHVSRPQPAGPFRRCGSSGTHVFRFLWGCVKSVRRTAVGEVGGGYTDPQATYGRGGVPVSLLVGSEPEKRD